MMVILKPGALCSRRFERQSVRSTMQLALRDFHLIPGHSVQSNAEDAIFVPLLSVSL